MEYHFTREEAMERERKDLFDRVDKLDSSDLPTANIMVAGITGSGKSTLINAIFGDEMAETGVGRPVTKHIDEYHKPEQHIRIWDTVGLEIKAETTRDSINTIRGKIAEKAESQDQFDKIHAIWYCVNSRSSRYQGAELEFIKNLYSLGVPFIIVLTQCIEEEDVVNAFADEIKRLNLSMGMGDIDVVQVCSKEFKMRGLPPIPAFGLEELVELTTNKLPSFIKSGFVASQRINKIQKREVAEDIIIEYVQAAKEGFWDKVPIANIFSTDKHVRSMCRKLAEVYNTQIPDSDIRRIIDNGGLDFSNAFFGLLSPVDFGHRKKLLEQINMKRNTEGFDVDIADLRKSDRVSILLAFYGYTFVDAIETVWEKLTETQLRDIEMVCAQLIAVINAKLREKRR